VEVSCLKFLKNFNSKLTIIQTFSLACGITGDGHAVIEITTGGSLTWTPSPLGSYTFDVCVEN